ncbi:MAG: NAD(P)-dependent oxidoreductase [PVC group bacterium]
MSKNNKALVTGGSGFIGSHLIEALLREGWEVRALVRETSSRERLDRRGLELAVGDLTEKGSLEKSLGGVAAIFHLAGRIKARSRDEYFRTNWLGTKNLLEAAAERAGDLRQFIYVSSLSAAGPSPDGHPLTEEEEARPVSLYGESKLAAEREAERFSDRLPIAVLRPAAVYGPRDAETLQVIKLARWGVRFRPGRADNIFSAVHVADLVDAILRAAENSTPEFRAYFIGDGNKYSWRETFDLLAAVLGKKSFSLTVPWEPARAGVRLLAGLFPRSPAAFYLDKIGEMSHNYWVCNISRARKELGFNPRYDLNRGLRETVDWYRTKGWL